MVETHDHFTKRLSALGRKHKQMTHGYTTRVTKDGLIVVQPKRARRASGMGAVKILLMLLVGFMGFKVFAVAAVGPVTYNERLGTLQDGTIVEQLGAKALAIDPVTDALAGSVGPAIR